MASAEQNSTRQQVHRVLIVTLALNLIVALSKIIIGLVSGALAVTADGFHSLVDGLSNVVALVANHLAARPPDADHPYGHRRFETIAALAIGAFLLLTAWEIVSSALERLDGSSAPPDVTPLTFGAMLATLAVNLFVTAYEAREGRRLRSELLIADAAHTRADVFVTLSVLASLLLISLFGWYWVDTFAALVIVVLIVRAALQVLRQTSSVLVDTAPYTPEQLTALAEALPSVSRVLRARSRGPSDAAHIDIDVQVPPETTTDHTAAIASAIRDKLNQQFDGVAEVEVHFVPLEIGERDYARLARARADALGLSTHEVRISQSAGGKVLEMHVEVPSGQTLDLAHQQVSQLERDVQANLPEVAEVITHIEPALSDSPSPLPPDQGELLKRRALDLLRRHWPDADWHHFQVFPSHLGFTLTMHVTLPPDLSLEAAHQLAESAETRLRAAIPQLARVTIHTEPPETGASP